MADHENRPSGELRQDAFAALQLRDPRTKLEAVSALGENQKSGRLSVDTQAEFSALTTPGAPERPLLVAPHKVPRRKLGSVPGRATLIHALAHIEFNAINLALDALTRFSALPDRYYMEWLQVAVEEAYHFELLSKHLQDLGFAYGDFTAHNGLWEMAVKTAHDPLVRMALVPRILEARGLDVTPGLQTRLQQAGDEKAVAILGIILRDEIGHVRIGNYWYHWLCGQRGLDPETYFDQLRGEYRVAPPHPPFNDAARINAGFSQSELARWADMENS